MMDLMDRLIWMSFGMIIGFALGHIVASLRAIKEEVDEIDTIVKNERNDSGFMRFPLLADIALIVVLAIVVWGSFMAQKASNEVEETQRAIARNSECTQLFLEDVLEALNERTTYTRERTDLNVDLQQDQALFLSTLLREPPPSNDVARESLRAYFKNLSRYIAVNAKAEAKAEKYPYPTVDDYDSCLDR